MKKSASKKKIVYGVAVLLILAAVIAAAFIIPNRISEKKASENEATLADETELSESSAILTIYEGVDITQIGTYAGYYVEDGSDEIVSGTAVVIVENNSDDDIQLLNFTVCTESGNEYEFELTTLFSGERTTVIEKNRKNFDIEDPVVSVQKNHLAVFAEKPSLHQDTFRLVISGNTIIVKNITDKPISAGRVFFKNISDDLLIGGITYMVSFENLAPDAEIALSSTHFREGQSRIMFVSYAE